MSQCNHSFLYSSTILRSCEFQQSCYAARSDSPSHGRGAKTGKALPIVSLCEHISKAIFEAFCWWSVRTIQPSTFVWIYLFHYCLEWNFPPSKYDILVMLSFSFIIFFFSFSHSNKHYLCI